MDRQHSIYRLTSQFVEDRKQGFGGHELIGTDKEGKRTRAATVIYRDGMGQSFVETFGDVPLASRMTSPGVPTRLPTPRAPSMRKVTS